MEGLAGRRVDDRRPGRADDRVSILEDDRAEFVLGFTLSAEGCDTNGGVCSLSLGRSVGIKCGLRIWLLKLS